MRAILSVVLGAVLVWQVVTRSLVAHLAVVAPETALMLDAAEPSALLSLADGALAGLELDRKGAGAATVAPTKADSAKDGKAQGSQAANERLRIWAELAKAAEKGRLAEQAGSIAKTSADPNANAAAQVQARAQVRALAEHALASEPLSARALRMLGQVAEAGGDEVGAGNFMRAATLRSNRESVATYWLMRKSAENKDYATALRCADILLRTRSETMPFVMPTLVQIADNKAASGELKNLLASNPPWRAQFFETLPRSVTDARAPLDILLAAKETPTPPTAADLKPYLDVLIAHKYFELAYYVWLQFIGPEQLRSIGLLFNGSFEGTPSGLPFDWVLRAGAGSLVEIVDRPDQEGQRALFIEFSQGRVEFPGVVQLIMLAPGTYRFRGKYRGELSGRRGLIWRAQCAGTDTGLGEGAIPVGPSPAWRDIDFTFRVPNTGCRAQQLKLDLDARMASEQLVSGTVWLDELRIQRVDG